MLLGHPAHPVGTFALSAGPESTIRQYRFAAHAMDFAKFLTLPQIAKAVWQPEAVPDTVRKQVRAGRERRPPPCSFISLDNGLANAYTESSPDSFLSRSPS